jgi:uncharacterized membrane protein
MWAASPALIAHAFTNWDLVAVACAAWGWLSWRQGRPGQSAFWFGLGGAAKLYGAFFLPFLLLAVVLERNQRKILHVLAGGFVGFGVPNLAVLASPLFLDRAGGNHAYDNWWGIWKFHARRSPDFETPWSLVNHYGREWYPDWNWGEGFDQFARTTVAITMAATLLVLAWRQWRFGLDPLVAGGLFVLIFLLVNTVYSPQYTLWALPILILLRGHWIPLLAFVLADFANFLVRYKLFTPPKGQKEGWNDDWMPWSRFLVATRWLLLLALVVLILLREWKQRDQAQATSGKPEASLPT